MTDPFHSRTKIKSEYVAAVAVTLAPIAYFLPAILNGAVLCPDDGILQNVPFRLVAAQIISSGYLPLWNPYIFSGMPLLASAQVGIFFPLNWFYLIASAPTATNLMVVSSYMTAALGAFLYARRIGSTIAGALITSLVWQCSGALVGQISHINIVHTSAMLPWALWSLESYAQTKSYKSGVLLSIAIAIQVFAGHPQAFVYSLILLTAYALFMAATNALSRKRYLSSLIFIAIGLLLSAVQIVPTVELLRNSTRVSASYEFFTSFSMPRRFVFALFAPYLMGGGDGRLFRAPYVGPPYYPELVGYVGILTLMLAIVALLIKRDRLTKFWAVIVVAGLLLALGSYAPLQFYRVIYYLPLLNLFRVPARHLMEVDFALAVLAGRGLSALIQIRKNRTVKTPVVIAGLIVFLFTSGAVVWIRPNNFHLGREAPVTLLRAPELFLPIIICVVSLATLWVFATGKRGATWLLFGLLAVDLFVWGQSSGWYTGSPKRNHEYWHQPDSVQRLQSVVTPDSMPYRILTLPHPFDPSTPPVPPSVSQSADWNLWTQSDVYMFRGIQNAAGYDGFGLRRYSDLAGRMKVWGELTDPDLTLRGESREIDLVNARYVLSMRTKSTGDDSRKVAASAFPVASVQYGGFRFAAEDLGLPILGRDKRLSFTVPSIDCDRIAIVTNLSWSENVADEKTVARLRIRSTDGRSLEFPLRAGSDTAEWSHDRPDIKARIKHPLASVASSYVVKDPTGDYEAHTYVASFALPGKWQIEGGDIVLEPQSAAPDLSLSVFRLSLLDTSQGTAYPVRRDWISIGNASNSTIDQPVAQSSNSRWKHLAATKDVDIYENQRALPRAWLASEVRVLDDSSMLEVIRSGKFSDGTSWHPEQTALIESDLSETIQGGEGQVQITRYEPNLVQVKTNSNAASVLVLSENHYPGWRTYVDGNAVETMRVDYNLRGVTLAAGAHQVEFRYRPKSVLIGLVLSLLGVAVLIAGRFGVRSLATALSQGNRP